MPVKKKEPKNVILDYIDQELGPLFRCPTCLHEAKNQDHICKYCNESLKAIQFTWKKKKSNFISINI